MGTDTLILDSSSGSSLVVTLTVLAGYPQSGTVEAQIQLSGSAVAGLANRYGWTSVPVNCGCVFLTNAPG